MTRWDSPLFTVAYDDETPPYEEIWEALVGSDGKAKVVRPNQATVLVRVLFTMGATAIAIAQTYIPSFCVFLSRTSKGITSHLTIPFY